MNSIDNFRRSFVSALRRSFSLMRINSLTSKMLDVESAQKKQQEGPKKFSSLSNLAKPLKLNTLNLSPIQFTVIPSCGIKFKGKLKRRCKDCYFARIDGTMMVLCSSYPRHKQKAKTVREKFTWILTSSSQSKLRPY